MRSLPGSTVVTAVRNEGPFLLEWIAWYKMLGFENILILHNDCTDRSPKMLRLLEREGVLTQKRHVVPKGKAPQPWAHRKASGHPLVQKARWVFVADVDEYLVIHAGDRSIAALAEEIAPEAVGMAINWRAFGSNGKQLWRDTFVHRRFTRAGSVYSQENACFKTFFRYPSQFGQLHAHGPRQWLGPEDWGSGDKIFLLADKSPYPEYHPTNRPRQNTSGAQTSNDLAQVNHYAVQSHEQMAFKQSRPAASDGKTDRYTDAFFARFDHNEMENTAALEYGAAFDREYEKLIAIQGVERLHHQCCADFVAAMCEKRGDDPKADPRYIYHRKTGHRLPRPVEI